MTGDVVVVFTGESLQDLRQERSSGHWKASRSRLCRRNWIVATRNRHAVWSAQDVEHGTAFMVGHISGIKDSSKRPGRYIIEFDRYAEINLKRAWPGNQNPVTYLALENLHLNLRSLEWKTFPAG
jgi:hypothetical protein